MYAGVVKISCQRIQFPLAAVGKVMDILPFTGDHTAPEQAGIARIAVPVKHRGGVTGIPVCRINEYRKTIRKGTGGACLAERDPVYFPVRGLSREVPEAGRPHTVQPLDGFALPLGKHQANPGSPA